MKSFFENLDSDQKVVIFCVGALTCFLSTWLVLQYGKDYYAIASGLVETTKPGTTTTMWVKPTQTP